PPAPVARARDRAKSGTVLGMGASGRVPKLTPCAARRFSPCSAKHAFLRSLPRLGDRLHIGLRRSVGRRRPGRPGGGMRGAPGGRSADVEDRRDETGGGGFGGMRRIGLGGIVVLLVLSVIFKRD